MESEVLSLRELLQMETYALAKAKAVQMTVTDENLKRAAAGRCLRAVSILN